jgi:hypothetical protein
MMADTQLSIKGLMEQGRSGCDPCPHSGVSYFDQICPGRSRDPRRHVLWLKCRRRAARRGEIRGARRLSVSEDFIDLVLRAQRELSEATFEESLAAARRRGAMRRYVFLVRFSSAVDEL